MLCQSSSILLINERIQNLQVMLLAETPKSNSIFRHFFWICRVTHERGKDWKRIGSEPTVNIPYQTYRMLDACNHSWVEFLFLSQRAERSVGEKQPMMLNMRSLTWNFIDTSLPDFSLNTKNEIPRWLMRKATPEYCLSVDGGPELQNIQFRDTSMLVVFILASVSTAKYIFLDPS